MFCISPGNTLKSGASRRWRTGFFASLLALSALPINHAVAAPIGYDSNDLLIADYAAGRIAIYDENLVFKSYLDSDFLNVGSLDMQHNGNLIAAGQNQQVKQYNPAGTVLNNFTNDSVATPMDIKSGQNGLVYIATQDGTLSVQKFNLAGNALGTIGEKAYSGLAVLPGNVLWAGASTTSIDVFDLTTGSLSSTIPFDNDEQFAQSLSYSADTGTVLIADGRQFNVYERTAAGAFVRKFEVPDALDYGVDFGVTRGPGSRVYATDYYHDRVLVWNADGSFVNAVDISDHVDGPANIVWTKNIPNELPVLATIDNGSVHAGEEISFTASASDADGDALTFSLEGAPSGASIDSASGAFSWTPAANTPTGDYTFKVVVSDGNGGEDEQEVTITVLASRYAPVLAPIGTKTVNEETTLTFTISASDQDTSSGSLTYSATGLPQGATFNPGNRTFSWTPTESQGPGTYNVTFKVSDGALTDSEVVTMNVREVNKPPVLNIAGGEQTLIATQPYQFTLSATDPDIPTQSLTYSLISAPKGATVNAQTGVITWKTPNDPPGKQVYNFTARVTDNGTPALNDTKSFGVTVISGNLLTVTPVYSNGGATLTVTLFNAGKTVIKNATVTGTVVPASSTLTASQGTVASKATVPSLPTRTVTWSDIKLQPGEQATLTIILPAVPKSGAITGIWTAIWTKDTVGSVSAPAITK